MKRAGQSRDWECRDCQRLEHDLLQVDPHMVSIPRTRQEDLLDLHRLTKHPDQMFDMYYWDRPYLKHVCLDWWRKRARDLALKLGM